MDSALNASVVYLQVLAPLVGLIGAVLLLDLLPKELREELRFYSAELGEDAQKMTLLGSDTIYRELVRDGKTKAAARFLVGGFALQLLSVSIEALR